MEANEEKRGAYEKTIKGIDPEDLVYIDESGIEITICKDKGWGKKGEKLVPPPKSYFATQNILFAGFSFVRRRFELVLRLLQNHLSCFFS